MKKMLEETFLTIEQMGYGIIDPVLAQWEVPVEKDREQTDLSDPIMHGKHSPVLFDDLWLEEYEVFTTELLARRGERRDLGKLFQEIEDLVTREGIWADKDITLAPGQIDLETVMHREEPLDALSSDNIFNEFSGWPAQTVDILSTSKPYPVKETERVVVELPLRIYSQPNQLVLEAELPGIINSVAQQNPNLRALLAHLPTGTDTYRIKTSVVNGELRLELPRR